MMSGRNDNFINVKCLRSFLGYSGRGVSDASPPACLALAAQSHCNLVTTRYASAHQNSADWRELWPRDASIWRRRQHPLLVSPRECVQHHAACHHTHIRARTQNYTQNPLCSLTDRNYRLFDFTESISNPRQLTDSPLRAGCWQGTHALFTNQRGFARHIMDVITLKFIWMNSDIKGSLNKKISIKNTIIFLCKYKKYKACSYVYSPNVTEQYWSLWCYV